MWALTGDSLLGPFDATRAEPLTDHTLYSGRLVRDPVNRRNLLAFRNDDGAGGFVGELSDPMLHTVGAATGSRTGRAEGPARTGTPALNGASIDGRPQG